MLFSYWNCPWKIGGLCLTPTAFVSASVMATAKYANRLVIKPTINISSIPFLFFGLLLRLLVFPVFFLFVFSKKSIMEFVFELGGARP
jgi:hypothetical protein